MIKLPPDIKEKAVSLRKKGYSVKEISDNLGIAKSTSSLWTRDVKLNKRASKRLIGRRLIGYYNAALRWKNKRKEDEKKYKIFAEKIIDKIRKDSNYNKVYCALLYWCEGTKGYKGEVRFANSDPALIKTFLSLLRSAFKIEERKFRVLMHLHEYHDEQKQKDFWSKLTKIPKNQFHKTFLKSHTQKRIKDDYQGCVAIYYNDCVVAREIKAIYKAFSE